MYKYKLTKNPISFLKSYYDDGGLSEIFFQSSKFIHQRGFYSGRYINGKEKTFSFHNQDLPYFYHPYNTTWMNERTIEIPLIMDILKDGSNKRILELGNVLKHYFPEMDHGVIDKYEDAHEVISEDIVDVKYSDEDKYDLLVSISTVEHVGWDDHPRDDEKIPNAIENIKQNVLTLGGEGYFTFPFGYNQFLDEIVIKQDLFSETYAFKKVDKYNKWVEIGLEEVHGLKYDKPFYNANGLILVKLDNQ